MKITGTRTQNLQDVTYFPNLRGLSIHCGHAISIGHPLVALAVDRGRPWYHIAGALCGLLSRRWSRGPTEW